MGVRVSDGERLKERKVTELETVRGYKGMEKKEIQSWKRKT